MYLRSELLAASESEVSFPFLSRRQMELLLSLITGRPKHLHGESALPSPG